METQLELFDKKSPAKLEGEVAEKSPAKLEGEKIPDAIWHYLNRDKSLGGKGHVEEYYKKKYNTWYFRFSYRAGTRMKSKHIPGGNINAKLANDRVAIIRQMIDRDAPTQEILKTIACFRKS